MQYLYFQHENNYTGVLLVQLFESDPAKITSVTSRIDIAIYRLYIGLPNLPRKYHRSQDIEAVERGPLPPPRSVLS